MNQILEEIYKDLMKIKSDEGEVSEELQTQYANTIREHFGKLTPADITTAMAIFKSKKLLPDDVCDKLESDRYLRAWKKSLDALCALSHELSNCNVSKEKVTALVAEINKTRGRHPDVNAKISRAGRHLLTILPRQVRVSDRALDAHDVCHTISKVIYMIKTELGKLAIGLPKWSSGAARPLAAQVLAGLSCCINMLDRCPKFDTYLRGACKKFKLVALPTDDLSSSDLLAKYQSIDLGSINLPGLISSFRRALRAYVSDLEKAGILD